MKRFFRKIVGKTLPFEYQIRRSKRASRARIVVTGDKIEVVAPPQIAENQLHDFVYAQRDWIRTAVGKMQRRRDRIGKMAPADYRHGVKVPFKGQYFPMTVRSAAVRRIRIEFTEAQGFIVHSPDPAAADHSDRIRAALTEWMKRQAKAEGLRYISLHSEKYRLAPRSLRVKTQRSRWGSCGVNNDINLNWLLIIAPPDVMEYVVVHELCHIRHRNHSSAFWDLVADHLPDYRDRRRWLKRYGQSLMLGL